MNLYTKYRSQKFSDVVGQKHVVSVISEALKQDRVGHAYLFSGPRGTGKTTIARLLAKSLNCENRKKGEIEPCDKCNSCKDILTGTSMDIIEIDAASNRGIDEIRALRDKVRFAASGNKFKVFIIDEVHMLTREAFNALLKTLEEPPKHVVFILATTELHKVLDTIISRTQQFDFSLHTLPDIIGRLKEVAKHEKIKIDDESLRLISQSAKGGMRDAISLLDQVCSSGKDVTADLTRNILGLSGFESLYAFWGLIYKKDPEKTFKLIDKMYSDGVDFYEFIGELLEIARVIMLTKSGYKKVLEIYPKDEAEKLEKLSRVFSFENISKNIKLLISAHNDTKYASITQLPLELAVVEMTGIKSDIDKKDNKNLSTKSYIKKKLNNKEVKIEKKVEEEKIIDGKSEMVENKIEKKTDKNVNIKFEDVCGKWDQVLEEVNKKYNSLKITLKNSKPVGIEDGYLRVAVQFEFYKERLEQKKNIDKFCSVINDCLGCEILPKFQVDASLVEEFKPRKNSAMSGISEEDAGLMGDAMDVFS